MSALCMLWAYASVMDKVIYAAKLGGLCVLALVVLFTGCISIVFIREPKKGGPR
jgi:hypothetical protein